MRSTRLLNRYQAGQAYAELVVGFSIIALFSLGSYHVWRYAEFQQAAVEAVRFAAWERVVWEPSDNSSEKFALHKSDEQLAKDTVLRQLSTPAAWRNFRSGLDGNGTPAQTSFADRQATLGTAVKSFVSPDMDPNSLISLTTTSGWTNSVEHWIRGRDPTFNTTTSLELDKDTYRTVSLTLKSQSTPATNSRFFGFLLPAVEVKKHLSLITNAWAASTPMMFIRIERQLLPFSTGDSKSGTQPNHLAFFGLQPSPDGIGASDFIGMAPFWSFVGGPHGLAGQYAAEQPTVSAEGLNSLLETKGQSFGINPSNFVSSFDVAPELARSEYFNPNAVMNSQQRSTLIISKTAEDIEETGKVESGEIKPGLKSRNSNLNKRKYRALSLQNPVETYFAH